jgi:hypothetical protein
MAGRDRGVFWDERRLQLVRDLLRQGYDRDLICQRLGVTRVVLREAITRHQLSPTKAA